MDYEDDTLLRSDLRAAQDALKAAWSYATGEDEPWKTISNEDAEAEGERFASIHRQVLEVLGIDVN